jgi:hypothetical protein
MPGAHWQMGVKLSGEKCLSMLPIFDLPRAPECCSMDFAA